MKTLLVSGYVPITGHPRTATEYGELGEKLAACDLPVKVFYNTIAQCWLKKYLWENSIDPAHSEGDNRDKNSLDYHIVNHQKVEWVLAASLLYPDWDAFVWVDYGIFRLPGVTKEVLYEFYTSVAEDDLAFPGCWEPQFGASDDIPNWRFCGSMFVVPRHYAVKLSSEVKKRVRAHLKKTNNVTWEVNTLAAVESKGVLPIRWYKADHNASMFNNYKVSLLCTRK